MIGWVARTGEEQNARNSVPRTPIPVREAAILWAVVISMHNKVVPNPPYVQSEGQPRHHKTAGQRLAKRNLKRILKPAPARAVSAAFLVYVVAWSIVRRYQPAVFAL